MTVTATLVNGFEWGQLPDGWSVDNPTTATFTVELVGTSCDEVTPVAPTVTQAVCVGRGGVGADVGVARSPMGSAIRVDAERPYAPGQTGGGDGDVGQPGRVARGAARGVDRDVGDDGDVRR